MNSSLCTPAGCLQRNGGEKPGQRKASPPLSFTFHHCRGRMYLVTEEGSLVWSLGLENIHISQKYFQLLLSLFSIGLTPDSIKSHWSRGWNFSVLFLMKMLGIDFFFFFSAVNKQFFLLTLFPPSVYIVAFISYAYIFLVQNCKSKQTINEYFRHRFVKHKSLNHRGWKGPQEVCSPVSCLK